jgi:hypothetical protein
VIPTKTTLPGHRAEFGKCGVQTTMQVLTFVGCRGFVLVERGLSNFVWVTVNGDPCLFPSAGGGIESAKCEVERNETETAKGVGRNAIHVANDSRKNVERPSAACS